MTFISLCLFECARENLGHGTTLTFEEVRALPESWEEALVAYAKVLKESNAEWDMEIDPMRPVLPVVDMIAEEVSHKTCTGSTEMCAGAGGVCYHRFTEELDSKHEVKDLMQSASPHRLSQWGTTSLARDALLAWGMPQAEFEKAFYIYRNEEVA